MGERGEAEFESDFFDGLLGIEDAFGRVLEALSFLVLVWGNA